MVIWELPSGRHRVEECARALERGSSLVLFASECSQAHKAVSESVTARGALSVATIETADQAHEPLGLLIDELTDPGSRYAIPRTLRGLINSEDLAYHLLLVNIGNSDPLPWGRFLKMFAAEREKCSSGTGAPILALVAPRAAAGFEGSTRFDDEGLLEPFDVARIVHDSHGWGSDIIAQTSASVAVEASAGDLCVAERLAGLHVEIAFDPTDWFVAQANADKKAERWRGKMQPNSAWLAANDPGALSRRIWRGQVAVLLPFVEDARAEAIRRHGGRLKPGAKDRETEELLAVEDYEWPELYRQFCRSSAPEQLIRLASEMRTLRNLLAHGRPVKVHEARAAVQAQAACR